eukprot:748145-Hanusia_phi.AAC.3
MERDIRRKKQTTRSRTRSHTTLAGHKPGVPYRKSAGADLFCLHSCRENFPGTECSTPAASVGDQGGRRSLGALEQGRGLPGEFARCLPAGCCWRSQTRSNSLLRSCTEVRPAVDRT